MHDLDGIIAAACHAKFRGARKCEDIFQEEDVLPTTSIHLAIMSSFSLPRNRPLKEQWNLLCLPSLWHSFLVRSLISRKFYVFFYFAWNWPLKETRVKSTNTSEMLKLIVDQSRTPNFPFSRGPPLTNPKVFLIFVMNWFTLSKVPRNIPRNLLNKNCSNRSPSSIVEFWEQH